MLNLQQFEVCAWEPTTWLFFSGNIWGDFIYYSHLFPSLSGLIISIFVFRYSARNKAAQALLFTSVVFTLWSLIDLFLWASDRPDLIMFAWSTLIYFELLIYIGCLYFVLSYTTGAFLTRQKELGLFLTFIPLFLFAHTNLNLTSFDFTNCWREAIEGPLWHYYVYVLEILIVAWIVAFTWQQTKAFEQKRRNELFLVSSGVILFLLLFSLGNLLGSFETDWEIGQIGLFGMPILVIFLAYAIVKYETFKAKVLAAEALFAGTFVLLFSLLFVRTLENKQVITIITIILFSVLGYFLIRNVRKEVEQRQQIEKLANSLQRANARLQEMDKLKSEFVSIASHQLRSPLTAIRGYASLLRDGTYGKFPTKANEPLERIEESAKSMALAIEDYLNVSRIEAGNMKYNMSDFNLRDEAERIVNDLRTDALKHGLVLLFRTDLQSQGIVHADIGKVQQILHNLINNAIKYTPKGSVVVFVREQKRPKRIHVDIIDTGIGMNEHTLHTIFQKFERASNANSVNVKGTGLGLYVSLKMAEAMGGTVTAHSDGDGKGSRFTLTLPLEL